MPKKPNDSHLEWIFDPSSSGPTAARNLFGSDPPACTRNATDQSHSLEGAPQSPVRLFQQDGHMAMQNPKGRANYEPNSWQSRRRSGLE